MQHIILNHLNMLTLSKNKDEFILWINHDRDYKYGWYYLIRKTGLYLVRETEITYEELLIKEFKDE